MKKLLYITGFFGAISSAIGVVFKLLHLPGANAFFIIGWIVLLLIFVPIFAILRYRGSNSYKPYERALIILGGISAVTGGLSGVFKTLQLQGADILLLMGSFIFVVGFLPLYFYAMYRKSIS